MVWLAFKKDFSWRQPAFTIDYKGGQTLNVTRGCADEALAKGVAVKTAAPRRDREAADGKST